METQLQASNQIKLIPPILNKNFKIKSQKAKIQTVYMPLVNLEGQYISRKSEDEEYTRQP